MNIYIILGVLYLIYMIYTRFKNAQANKPKMENPSGRPEPQKEEGLLERLRRMAEEAGEQQRQAQQASERQSQQSRPMPQYQASQEDQEYPEEWIITETGTKVHDLEGRKLRAEYLKSKESTTGGYDGTIKEEYNRDQKVARTMDSKMVEEYNASHQQGRPISHMGHGHGVKKVDSYKRVETRIKKLHPLRGDLFNPRSIRKAIVLKEIIERPKF